MTLAVSGQDIRSPSPHALGMRRVVAIAELCRREAGSLKECVADLTLENRLLKKSMTGDGGDDE